VTVYMRTCECGAPWPCEFRGLVGHHQRMVVSEAELGYCEHGVLASYCTACRVERIRTSKPSETYASECERLGRHVCGPTAPALARAREQFDAAVPPYAGLGRVLGACVHGVNLDRAFCPHGCKV
jgi:hypothetical protein